MTDRILYLYAQPYRAGSLHARQTEQMLALLQAQGLEVDVLTLPGGDPWPAGLCSHRYLTIPIPGVRSLPLYGYGWRRVYVIFLLVFATIHLFLRHRYTVIHCADREIRIGRLIAWLFGAKFVFEWRASSGYNLIRWLNQRSRRFIRSVNLVISDVSYPLAQLKQTGLAGRVASNMLLPAPDIQRFPPPSARLQSANSAFRVTFFSRTADLQDLATYIDALPLAAKKFPAFRFTFVGGTDEGLEALRKKFYEEQPALAPSIELLGPCSDHAQLNALFARTDLVALPAEIGEQPPAILLDAMNAQRAILAMRCPANASLLWQGAGTLVPVDISMIAKALVQYACVPLLAARHAQRAAEIIDSERNPNSAMDSLRSCYLYALSSHL